MALEGHEVASRGLTGKMFPLAPNNAIMTQVREASDILHNITGTVQEYTLLFIIFFSFFLSSFFYVVFCYFFIFVFLSYLFNTLFLTVINRFPIVTFMHCFFPRNSLYLIVIE